jgi:hypothetical protein
MMVIQPASPARSLATGSAIVTLGVLVALVTVLALTLVRPALVVLAFGGLVILIPTFILKDARAYWLFLLVVSIPFDISKRTTTWLVDPWMLLREYGPPAGGTLSLDFYLTDIVLGALLLPWLASLCLRRDRLYFPKIGYIFVLYLAWALIVSLIQAESYYLSIFQWCRQVLYLLSFIYLINNIVTPLQLRAVVAAIPVGLIVASATVITFFYLGIGTETNVFSGLYSDQGHPEQTMVMYDAISGSYTKRSAGIFGHPALAACFLELTFPIALGYMMAARRHRDRIFFGALFASGCVASYLTFSRAGLVGLTTGCIVFFCVGRWSRLISRRAFARCVFIFAMAAAVSAPLLIYSLGARPQSVSRRFDLIEITLDAYWQRPILGTGLNNSSAAIKEPAQVIVDRPGARADPQSVPVQYLVTLMEVGPVGFLLFFTFFWKLAMVAFRTSKAVETEIKVLLVGIVGGLAGVATQNLADNVFGAHSINAMIWLFASLIIAIARRARARVDRALLAPSHGAAIAP